MYLTEKHDPDQTDGQYKDIPTYDYRYKNL